MCVMNIILWSLVSCGLFSLAFAAKEDSTNRRNCEFTTEGARWRKSCNWCRCHKTEGYSMCTRRGCPPDLEIILRESKQCELDARWKKDSCNWCDCIDEQAHCTNNKCNVTIVTEPKRREGRLRRPTNRMGRLGRRAQECRVSDEGSGWFRSCNWCRCSPRLKRGVCTRKRCSPNYIHDKEYNCKGNASWLRNNCNWCNCIDGHAACTEKYCVPSTDQPPFSTSGVSKQLLKKDDEKLCERVGQEKGRWRTTCNWCFCRIGKPFCSKLGCSPSGPKEFNECEGSVKWKNDCNWCQCIEGRPVCTEIGCNPMGSASSINAIIVIVPDDSCKNGSSWTDKCNTCHCIDGEELCTLNSCPETLRTSQLLERSQSELEKLTENLSSSNFEICKNGSRWRKSCNWCHCTNDSAACTLKGCLSDTIDEPQCEEGSEWKDECNFCSCLSGISICTTERCSHESDDVISPEVRSAAAAIDPVVTRVKASSEMTCTEGSQWMKNCNWCSCNGGVSVCTLTACLNDTRSQELEGTCKGESKWKIKCNWCHCSNGRGICTQKYCLQEADILNIPALNKPEPLPSPLPPKEKCTPGNTWIDKCSNTCICINGIEVCTKKACETVVRNDQCSTNARWKEDCNNCFCMIGQPICTRRMCKSIEILPELCHLPAIIEDAITCLGFEHKWTFVKDEKLCKQIVYGGCGGTENLFDSEEECYNTCGSSKTAAMLRSDLPSKEWCNLPTDNGKCHAMMPRYAFVPERNRCEVFGFSGCQGNRNNFKTANDCHNLCGGEPPVVDPNCDRSKCNWKRYAHYFVKKCSPIYQGGSCCPTKFECNDKLEDSPIKCYYKNKEFNVGDRVPVDDLCSTSCKCREQFRERRPSVECASIECPSLFIPTKPNCRLLYTEDSCCSTSQECSDPNTPPDVEVRTQTCEWNGKVFRLGDKMYFDDNFKCQSCVCTSGFSGPKGPGCRKVDCGFEFRYRERIVKGCTPLFFEDGCCPIDWVCPNDAILSRPPLDAIAQVTPVRSALCVTGNISVPVGSDIPVSDCHMKCSCVTPPDITCVKFRSCEMAEAASNPQKLEAKCAPSPASSSPCSSDCTIEFEPSSGCPSCLCSAVEFRCPVPTCPTGCINPTISFEEDRGCTTCKCQCMEEPECPSGCIVRLVKDPHSGCEKCECDPTDSFNSNLRIDN